MKFLLLLAVLLGPITAAAQSVLVSTIKLTPGSLPATTAAYGSIIPGPAAETAITLQAGGIVSQIPVLQGQQEAAGDVLAVITPDAQSAADLQKAKDALQAAKANRTHVTALLASRLATNADLAAADQSLADATATLDALQTTGSGAARTIKAPFAGIISAVLVSPGFAQPAGTALFRLVNSNGLAAMAGLAPAQTNAVTPGDPVSLMPLNGGVSVPGRVTQITQMLDPQTGLRNLLITPDNPASLVLNEPVQAVITTGTLSGYVVPRDAIQNDENGDYAFQVDAKNIAHRVTVTVLGNAGSQAVIAADLNTAMPFVSAGAYQLNDGMAVRTSP